MSFGDSKVVIYFGNSFHYDADQKALFYTLKIETINFTEGTLQSQIQHTRLLQQTGHLDLKIFQNTKILKLTSQETPTKLLLFITNN
jgi:hypothetical protein